MRHTWVLGLFVAAGARLLAAPAGAAAVPAVDLTDPAGDVLGMNGPGNDRDVVKLSLTSDGTTVRVSATLAQDEHGDTAGGPAGAPLEGRVLTGAIPYGALGARPGQVLRISALETSGNGAAGFFPDVLLALK